MTADSRLAPASVLRALAVLGAVAIALALLPSPARGQNQQDDDTDGAPGCPEDEPSDGGFADRAQIPDAHAENVDCAALFEIVQGFDSGEFRPTLDVRRDQMASFIARTLDAAKVNLPPAGEGRIFADTDADNPHTNNVRRLEAAGIVQGGALGLAESEYGPNLSTRRDQMTSLLVRAAEHAREADLASGSQQFEDVPSTSAHFENINAAAQEGLVRGVGNNRFAPDRQTRRDQMTTFVTRLLDSLAVPAAVAPPETATANASETATVRARVFNQFRERAGSDARVGGGVPVTFRAEHDGGAEVDPAEETVDTGEDGEAAFTFSTDETGTVTVTLSVPERDGNYQLGEGNTAQMQVEMVPDGSDNGDTGAVSGTVTDTGGDPVDNAEVRLVLSDATFVQTNDQGDYRFDGLTAGEYIVHVEDVPEVDNFGCEPEGHDGEVDLGAGEERDDIDFVCDLESPQEGT